MKINYTKWGRYLFLMARWIGISYLILWVHPGDFNGAAVTALAVIVFDDQSRRPLW